MQKIYSKINELLNTGEIFALATIIRKEGSTPCESGSKMIILQDGSTFGTIGGGSVEFRIIDQALEVIKTGKSKVSSFSLDKEKEMLCGGKMEVFIDLIEPKPSLIIIGSGHISIHLSKLGSMVGFDVTVIDPFGDKEKFPEAKRVIESHVDEALSKIKILPNTYIVIASRHQYDVPALKNVINSSAAYIGMVGSKNRIIETFKQMTNLGYKREKLLQINTPIGLDLGAKSPEEIAVSIISEIISHRYGTSGKPLKLTKLDWI